MGTVMTVCMFIGLIYGVARMVPGLTRRAPSFVHWAIGGVVVLAGCWNVLWYASRHITQFWGIAALLSGIALITTGYFIIATDTAPALLQKLMPVVMILLFCFMMLYGITIYRL